MRALAALYAAGGIACFTSNLFPLTPEAPVTLGRWISAFALLVVALLLTLGRRGVSDVVVHGLLAIATLLTCLLVSQGTTSTGVILSGLVLPWIAVYAAAFMTVRETVAHLVLISVAFATALVIADVGTAPRIWIMLVGSAWLGALLLARANERLHTMASRDPLTNALNRAGLAEVAAHEAARARRNSRPLTVAMLDLDGFKHINDTEGHARGDALLVDAVAGWRRSLRASDVLARHGGDEFVVLLPDTNAADAERIIERVQRDSITGFSYGLASWGLDDDLDSVLRRADAALLQQKTQRRSRRAGGSVTPLRVVDWPA